MQVTSAYAKASLSELKAVGRGEPVQITRYNKATASLISYTASQSIQPKLGTAPSSVKIVDPNWAKPLMRQQMKSLIETGS